MGTLENQSFKPRNQTETRDDKMPNLAPPTGVSQQGNTAPNMIGDGGGGVMQGSGGGNRTRAGMGSDRIPTEGNTASTGTA